MTALDRLFFILIQDLQEARGNMEPDSSPRGEEQSGNDRLYTLSEVSTRTGISMPTLQRYKKTYQSRIPAVGKGRKQRYPESALPVFEELKNENAGRRGRPRKDASAAPARRGAAKKAPAKAAGGRRAAASKRPAPEPAKRGRGAAKATAAKATSTQGTGARRGRPPGSKNAQKPGAQKGSRSGNLMTLTQVSEQTGISYPTLVRYVRLHSDRLPSEGAGRSRRFYPDAVAVFRELRQESGRGGRKKGSGRAAGRPAGRGRAASAGREEGLSGILQQRLKALEKSQENLEKRFRGFVSSLQKLFR
jgi:DNA-binding transcriptional MerR regulator